MKEEYTPYEGHIFICGNERIGSSRPSCGPEGKVIKDLLKRQISSLSLSKRIRVSESCCLGQCPQGPNIMIYPQEVWFNHVSDQDIPKILNKIKELFS